MIEIGTLLQDRYLIEKRIGAGGMGAVYLAVDRRFENYVAIKETFYMNDEFGKAFEREARLLNGLHHPVLPHVSDYFTENNLYFLVMQYIEGDDLSAIIKREGAFPVKDVLHWTDSLLDALDYLHSQNPPVIHRDIKPQNLKLTPRGDVILLDFGLAKLNSDETTGIKSVFGYSRRYSPLEQIQGTGTDARSDIFSLGATAYQLLTGKPPIDVLARAAEIVAGNPDPLKLASEINSEVPAAVASVLNSALALNAERRFISANAMRQAFKYAVNEDAVEKVSELPEQVSSNAQPIDEIKVSNEINNFPALEAFVAEAVNKSAETSEKDNFKTVEFPILESQKLPPKSKFLEPNENVVKAPISTASPVIKKRFPIAALAALFLFVSLATGFFIYTSNPSSEANQTATLPEMSESNSKTEQPEIVLEPQTPMVSESPELENVALIETESVSMEKIADEKEAPEVSDILVVRKEKIEKPEPEPVKAEKPRPTSPVKTSRRSKSNNDNLSRPRTVNSEPVPDIEAIFTGRSSKGNKKSQQKEDRRERRRERKQNKNQIYFPF